MSLNGSSPGRLQFPALFVLMGLLPLPAAAFLHATTDSDSGRALYDDHCAACHGVNLGGRRIGEAPMQAGSTRRRLMTRPGTPGTMMMRC